MRAGISGRAMMSSPQSISNFRIVEVSILCCLVFNLDFGRISSTVQGADKGGIIPLSNYQDGFV